MASDLTTWLREWVNPKISDEALAERLTMAGLEVDSIVPVAPYFENVVVGYVMSCEKHPNADKLSLCQVNIGENNNLQIICGAVNIRANLKVIVAMVGAILPNGLKIKKAKIRGVESFGMICSEVELGIADDSNSISELDSDAPIGKNIRKYLDLDDNIIELNITPNRADCFSVLGVAREVSANYGLPFKMPNISVSAQGISSIKTNVSNTTACPKYLTRSILGIDNTVEIPKWMVDKLMRSGQVLHSPVVDIINYVLLELGQPMHAFDALKINGSIEVRNAKLGEKCELLNETIVTLQGDTLVISDDEKVLAIAGVIGSMLSSTQPNSIDILLESAFFNPISIAGIARNYGLHTESSLRFERGVDFAITEVAMERATQLIIEICGGRASDVSTCIDKVNLPELTPITITQDKIYKILGFELDSKWVEEKFIGLGFEICDKTDNSWTIIPPSFRFDIRISLDLIEELARLYGYDKLPVQKLMFDVNIDAMPEAQLDKYDISQFLVARGYQEVITYSFVSEKYHNLINANANKIVLSNPISADMSVMRSSLMSGLLQSVESNQRRGHSNARFFEIGLCFDGIEANKQLNKLAGIISGNRFNVQWASEAVPLDFFDAKADLESLFELTSTKFTFTTGEHPVLQKGQTAKIEFNAEQVGWIGALAPNVAKELSLPKCYLFEIELNAVLSGRVAKYKSFSQYQEVQRDIALMLNEAIPVAELINSIEALQQPDFVNVNLFDIYAGKNIEPGKKSVALNLTYQSLKATLNDDEVNSKVSEVLALMQKKFDAVQR